jgi:hypothetical protein
MAHGKNWREFPVIDQQWLRLHDPYAHSLTVITEEHRLAHDGMMFNYTHKFLTVVNGATVRLLLAPPAGCFPHMNRLTFNVGKGDVDIVAYEGPTVTDYGTLVPDGGKPNTNRNSSNTASLAVYEEPTVSATGSSLHRGWAPPTGTGAGASANGFANLEAGEEWILKPGVEYLIEVTNLSGATIDMHVDMLWYELSYLDV